MDKDFAVNLDGLHAAVELMGLDFSNSEGLDLPIELPQFGVGSTGALNSLAPNILGGQLVWARPHHLRTWTRQPHGLPGQLRFGTRRSIRTCFTLRRHLLLAN